MRRWIRRDARGWPGGPDSASARTGSTARHGSGEIFLGLATGLRAPRGQAAPAAPLAGRELDPLFAAVVETTEEAVLNSLLAAVTVSGRDGHTSYALPHAQLVDLLKLGA